MDIMTATDRTLSTRNSPDSKSASYFILLSFGISIKTSIIFGGLGPGPNELREMGIYNSTIRL